jgi:hypothetical protein
MYRLLSPQRYHAPPSALLDIDVRDILSGTVTHVASTETSLRFDAFEASSADGGHADDGVGERSRPGVDRSRRSSPPHWQPPPRRGSLLDWEADAHLAQSQAPRRGSLVLQDAGLGGWGSGVGKTQGAEEEVAQQGQQAGYGPLRQAQQPWRAAAASNHSSNSSGASGTLTYSQRTTHREVKRARSPARASAPLHRQTPFISVFTRLSFVCATFRRICTPIIVGLRACPRRTFAP